MQRRIHGLLFLSLMIGSVAWGSGSGLQVLWNMKRPRRLIQRASQVLATTPDDTDAMLWLGIVWSSMGNHPDATAAFALAPGGPLYERMGLEAHATTIRAQGHGQAAFDLRQQRLVHASLSVGQELKVWEASVADLLMAGDLLGAEAAAWQAVSLFPQGVLPHLLLANVALENGDVEEARQWLALAAQFGGALSMPKFWHTSLRCALLDGDELEIEALLDAYLGFQTSDGAVVAFYAEVQRERGDPATALYFLTRAKMLLTEHPDVLAARVRARADLQDWSGLQSDWWRLKQAYPHHPITAVVAAYLAARRPMETGQ